MTDAPYDATVAAIAERLRGLLADPYPGRPAWEESLATVQRQLAEEVGMEHVRLTAYDQTVFGYPRYVELLAYFPGFDYRRCVDPLRVNFSRPDNVVGHQQRAFNLWWAIHCCAESGGLGLEIGAGQVTTPWCLSTDIYRGAEHPHYGGRYEPHVVARGEDLSLFRDEGFVLVLANHVVEHLPGDIAAMWRDQWLRVLRPGGILAAILPDVAYVGRDQSEIDTDHHHAWTADEFRAEVVAPLVVANLVEIVEFDTLKNHFSFNVVLRRPK